MELGVPPPRAQLPVPLEFDLDLPPLRGRFLIEGAEGMPLSTFN